MKKNTKGIMFIALIIIVLLIAFILLVVFAGNKNNNNDIVINNNFDNSSYNINNISNENNITDLGNKKEELSDKNLFNRKIIHNFGYGKAYEIDIQQIINDYKKISIGDSFINFSNGNNELLSISKKKTLFNKIPPNEPMLAGSSKVYSKVFEDESKKLYQVTYSSSYVTPDGAKTDKEVSYELYRKEAFCTLIIKGNDKDKVLKISSLVAETNKSKTLEEQFYGITVLDNRIIDTSKVTIGRICNTEDSKEFYINVGKNKIGIIFLSEKDTMYSTIKNLTDNWNLIIEKDGYKIYHGFDDSVQSDALKVVKGNKEYYIDMSVDANLYIEDDTHLPQKMIKEIVQEIINILK